LGKPPRPPLCSRLRPGSARQNQPNTGRSIAWDGTKEEIVGDPEATRLLRRPYRAPWVYPELT